MTARARSLVAAAAFTLLLVACGGGAEPAGTGDDASDIPAEEEFTPEPIVAPSKCSEPSKDLTLYAQAASWVDAKGKTYEPLEQCLSVAADEAFSITQHNLRKRGVLNLKHNFSIYSDSIALDRIFTMQPWKPGKTKTFEVPPLASGNYLFRCDAHARYMKGVLVVQ